jgi:hypothetical protein
MPLSTLPAIEAIQLSPSGAGMIASDVCCSEIAFEFIQTSISKISNPFRPPVCHRLASNDQPPLSFAIHAARPISFCPKLGDVTCSLSYNPSSPWPLLKILVTNHNRKGNRTRAETHMSLDKLDRQRRLSYTSTAYYDELVFSKELSLCCPAVLGRG